MLPFSKHNYINEWSQRVVVDDDLFQRVNKIEGRTFNPKSINTDHSKWYANNALIRYEFPLRENDSGIASISDMFKTLCKHRNIPDMEFFVNKRDFPILTRNGTEPYDHMFGDECPLLSHAYNKYCPIFSMVESDGYADIPIPTWNDWGRVSDYLFPKISKCTDSFDIPWEDKMCTAIFRGSSTGRSVRKDENMRLKIACMGKVFNDNSELLLDAGITSYNARPRKDKNSDNLNTFDIAQLPDLVSFMTPKEQSAYKYIVHIEGHVAAYRLSLELSMGSVILLVPSNYCLWYFKWLEPWIHYVPIKPDLSDLIEQIQWCRSNDDVCYEITQNAISFYNKYLTFDGILDYLQQLCLSVKCHVGDYTYNNITPLTIQRENEESQLHYLTNVEIIDSKGMASSDSRRTWDSLRRIQLNLQSDELSHIYETDTFQANRNTSLTQLIFNGERLVSKRKSDAVHEAFVGEYCINEVLKYIPNFVYTYGIRDQKLIVEYCGQGTFEEYLKGDRFRFSEYLDIMGQIALALHEAQERFAFVHHDLYPWNILLSRVPKQRVQYRLEYNKWVTCYPTFMPFIIDYEKSHCIVNNRHYGIINPFKSCRIHDILCILISSLSIIIRNHTLNSDDLGKLFHLTTFFSNTGFTQYQTFNSMKSLKKFLNNAKKFASMTTSQKYELSNQTPMDFIDFLNRGYQCRRMCFNDMRATLPYFMPDIFISEYSIVQIYLDSIKNTVTDNNNYIPLDLVNVDPITLKQYTLDSFEDTRLFMDLYEYYSKQCIPDVYLTQFKQILIDCLQYKDQQDIYTNFKQVLTLDTHQWMHQIATIYTFLDLARKIAEANENIPKFINASRL
jgi:hypothetical protein